MRKKDIVFPKSNFVNILTNLNLGVNTQKNKNMLY